MILGIKMMSVGGMGRGEQWGVDCPGRRPQNARVERGIKEATGHSAGSQEKAMTGAEDLKRWFTSVVEDNYRLLYVTAFHLLSRRQDAEDAVQEGVLKAYGKLATLKSPEVVLIWLKRIVRHTALDMLRGRRRKDEKHLDEAGWEAAGPVEAPMTDQPSGLEAGETGAALSAAMARLPAAQSAVVELRHLHDLGVEQIAARLGVTENVVRVRLFRAYENLRKNPHIRRAIGMEC